MVSSKSDQDNSERRKKKKKIIIMMLGVMSLRQAHSWKRRRERANNIQ